MISTLVYGWADWMLSGPYTPRGLTEAVARQILAPVLAELEVVAADRERLKLELHRVMADLAVVTEVAAVTSEANEQLRQERAEALAALPPLVGDPQALPTRVRGLVLGLEIGRQAQEQLGAALRVATRERDAATKEVKDLRQKVAAARPRIDRGDS